MLAFGIDITTEQIADGAITTPKLADGAVTNAKLADMAQGLLKGRAAGGGTGDPQDLTATQVKAILELQADEIDFDNVTSGLTATTVQDAIDELDALVDTLGDGMVFKGSFDAGGGTGPVNFPGAGAAQAGWFYPVVNANAAGTTVGSSNPITVHTGDKLIAAVDNASATDGADWDLIDGTDAVTSVAGKVGTVVLEAPDITNIPTDRLVGRDTAGTGVAEHISVGGGIEFGGVANLQRSALTGDVTASAGSNATTIAANVVSNAKLAQMAQGLIKGRAAGAGTGDPTDLTGAQVKAIIGAIQTADIGDDQVTFAKFQNIATDTLLGRDTAGTGDPESISLLGDLEFNGSGALRIAAFTGNATKVAGSTTTIVNAAGLSFNLSGVLGFSISADQNNFDAGGDLELAAVLQISSDAPRNITGMVPTAISGLSIGRVLVFQNTGSFAITLVDDSASSTAANRFAFPANVVVGPEETVFLVYAGSRWRLGHGFTRSLTGDVTGSGSISTATTIANDAVTNAKAANMAQATIKGRQVAGGTGDPEDLTSTQARAVIFDLLTAKGSIAAATAAGTVADLPAGADGTVLQAFAGATPGLRYAGAPLTLVYGRAGIGSNVTVSMGSAITDGDVVIPSGWILKIVALSAHSSLTTANTLTLKLHVDDVDQSGSFGTLQLAASTTDPKDDAEPTSPPFVVDASGGSKRVGFVVTSSNGGGGSAACNAMIFGYLYKAT